MNKKLLFILSTLTIALSSKGQQAIVYNKDFSFKEGVYLSFDQFRDNKPIEKGNLIATGNKEALNYIDEALNNDLFKWKTPSGKDSSVKVTSIWGYCQNNAIYINTNEQFSRIIVIGTVCHFTATITTYMHSYNPMVYGAVNVPTQEVRQFILDTETGHVYEYTLSQLEMILQRDPKLFNEFDALKKKQKREMMFVYLRKYNELHPLYFPVD